MNERKATKRALLTSITALVMCVVMLAGTTFAWFTDTATANVNKIQAGNLDVALEMLDTAQNKWVTAEGKTLYFRDKNNETNILWEPGATFNLDTFKIVNKGNLAIKYEITVNGVTGSNKLLKAIDFTVTKGGTSIDLANLKGVLLPTGKTAGADEEVGETAAIVISGTMKTSAGNEYKNLTLDGISITVKAMQASYEYDSNGNTYDGAADMTPDNLHLRASANVTKTVNPAQETEFKNENGTVTLTAPAGSISTRGDYTLSVVPMASGNITAAAGTAVNAYDIKLKAEDGTVVAAAAGTTFTVQLKIGAGLKNVKVFHNGTEITPITYDETAGIVTFTTDSFSIFDVQYDAPTAMIVGGECYTTLADAVAAAEDGDTVTLLKSTNGGGIVAAEGKFAAEGLTVDFNGHSYTVGGVLVGSAGTGTNAFQLNKGNKITFKNGTIAGVTEGTKPAEDTPNWHGAPAIVIQNYCDLTLDNMTVSGGDETVYTMSNNNGDVIIKDTTINEGKAKGSLIGGPFAFDVCRYSEYPAVSVTVTGDSVINGDVEVSGTIGEGQSRQLTINSGKFYGKFKVANEPANITINGGEFVDLANAVKYAADGATIKLAEDVTIAAMLEFPAEKAMTIDLNGKTITATGNNIGKWAQVYGNVTFKGEGFVGDATNESVGYLFDVRGNGVLNFEGDATYQCGLSIVQMFDNATVNISDGKFVGGSYNGKYWTLNKIDAYRNTTTIKATGGQFYKFDPSNGQTENPADNFVADGYKVVSETQTNGDVWYTVVPL